MTFSRAPTIFSRLLARCLVGAAVTTATTGAVVAGVGVAESTGLAAGRVAVLDFLTLAAAGVVLTGLVGGGGSGTGAGKVTGSALAAWMLFTLGLKFMLT